MAVNHQVMDLRPYEGFGPFRFGMTRKEARGILGGGEPGDTDPNGRYTHRLSETVDTAAAYHFPGGNVQFGDDGLVCWIVSFHYALPMVIEGITVPRSWRRAVKALDAVGARLTNDLDMRSVWSSEPLGFWLQKEDDRNVVWSVAAHVRGEA